MLVQGGSFMSIPPKFDHGLLLAVDAGRAGGFLSNSSISVQLGLHELLQPGPAAEQRR